MTLDQLEAFYDGRIPEPLRRAALDRLMSDADGVGGAAGRIAQIKIINVTRRPCIVLPRMAETIRELLNADGDNAGAVTEHDLIARGYSAAEIAAYANSAHEMAVN